MDDSQNNWINIADVMSALMMIFMFISIAFLYQILTEKQIYKVSLNEALHKEFDKDLYNWQVIITDDNSMRFNSPFEAGSKELPKEFLTILDQFFPRYIQLLSSEKFKNEIEEIRIEGHTSNGWGDITDKKQIYLNNMNLSQARASNVLAYCYNLESYTMASNLNWLQKKLRANGVSFSKLLYKENTQEEDKEKSRRVEFRVITKDHLGE